MSTVISEVKINGDRSVAMSMAMSVATSAEILVELSLERYAVGISHQVQLVLKS